MARIRQSPPCEVCGVPSVAKKLCDKHYRRLTYHGHVEATLRPPDWGVRRKHPLYEKWRWMARHISGGRGAEWADFWKFVEDVGPAPSPKHRLARYDSSKGHGPDNTYWREPLNIPRETLLQKTAYQREYAKRNPFRMKAQYLKRSFGMSLVEYDRLVEEQMGACAVCGGKDKMFALAVDHCHKTNVVRGLLCSQCNRGIGLFRDSPDRLKAAARYLLKHQRRPRAA